MHDTGDPRDVEYVLGVDAGNTKTIALVARRDGTVFGMGRSGCGDIYSATGAEAALTAIDNAATQALRMAGASPAIVLAMAFNLAGADWPEDFDFLHAELERRGYRSNVQIVNDAMGALRAGSPDGTGVVVVCGTGAAIGARAPDGRCWHTSHWQGVGGGVHLAEKALAAAYRAELGIDPPTTLSRRVMECFGEASIEAVLHRLTARLGTATTDLGPLTRALLDEAALGDPVAEGIVRDHGEALGDYALAAARRIGLEGAVFTLVLAGGVLRHDSSLLADALIARVYSTSPLTRPLRSRFEPAVGALFLALDAASVPVDEALLERLEASLPPGELFAT